jgi:hypothetical protein
MPTTTLGPCCAAHGPGVAAHQQDAHRNGCPGRHRASSASCPLNQQPRCSCSPSKHRHHGQHASLPSAFWCPCNLLNAAAKPQATYPDVLGLLHPAAPQPEALHPPCTWYPLAATLVPFAAPPQGPARTKIDKMSSEVVDSNPYSRLMALQRMGIVKDYEKIRGKTVGGCRDGGEATLRWQATWLPSCCCDC